MRWRVIAVVLVAAACGSARAPAPTTSSSSTSTTSTTTTSTTTAPSTSTVTATAPAVPATPCGRPGPVRYDHVVWIWMENHTRGQALGGASAPYLASLARGCATAADYRAVGSPSLPNYLGATSGTTSGVTDDASASVHPISADNLFRQVRRSGGSAVTLAESMPGACTLTGEGRYAVKHNPAAYYVGDDDRAACERDDRPMPPPSTLAGQPLASFTMVVPDLCHDTHDCSVATGDQWLASWLPAFLSNHTDAVVFVVWDEPTPMPFIAVAPSIAPGTTVTGPVDHYALLRTTEDLLGIADHLGAAGGAPSMRPALGI